MQRYLLSTIAGISLCMATGMARADATCPVTDVRAAVNAACSCTDSRNHGQYMKCVRKQVNTLARSGCDTTNLIRCAAASTCGRPHGPAVCCNARGRAKILDANKCTKRGGTVQTGVTSLCDAVCPTPSTP